jgi:two-component system nitrogen regulation response regulator GlnG
VFSFLAKPFDGKQLLQHIDEALQRSGGSASQATDATSEVWRKAVITRSPLLEDLLRQARLIAASDASVLLRGESGSGKEVLAKAIHLGSPRCQQPFVPVNSGAIPESLLESELFGYTKGAFTGALRDTPGLFLAAHRGTLFLDEIGDMSPLVQSKVLRVLQSQEFERVGSNTTIKTDVRVIAATNRDLEKMAEEGEFRSDLYYRLSGFSILLPPLRDRRDDIVALLERYLAIYSRELGKDIQGVTPEALELFLKYPWPGNIRELQNVLKQTLLRSVGNAVIPEFLPESMRNPQAAVEELSDEDAVGADLRPFFDQRLSAGSNNMYAEALEFMERYVVSRVLMICEGNQSKAARMLGITRGCLRSKVRALGVSNDTQVQVKGEPCEV